MYCYTHPGSRTFINSIATFSVRLVVVARIRHDLKTLNVGHVSRTRREIRKSPTRTAFPHRISGFQIHAARKDPDPPRNVVVQQSGGMELDDSRR
jgi:hypothetical protein